MRQVVHHVADSHANSYVRFKLALTEEWPTIKPYDEAAWADLADSRKLPVEPSLSDDLPRCMLAGSHCSNLFLRKTFSAATTIPRGVARTWPRLWRFTRGIRATTPPTSSSLRARMGW